MLRQQTWLLGPSAAEDAGVTTALLHRLGVPEDRQQIFQSHAAALEETKRGRGITLTLSFAVAQDLASGQLVQVPGRNLSAQGSWHISTLGGGQATPAAEEMTRFITTPRATQAMLRGPRRRPRPLPARRPRHALELTRRRVTDRSGTTRRGPAQRVVPTNGRLHASSERT